MDIKNVGGKVLFKSDNGKPRLERKCRICGCTEENCGQCIAAQGYPCSWVEEDLCSRCKNEADEKIYLGTERKDRRKKRARRPKAEANNKAEGGIHD